MRSWVFLRQLTEGEDWLCVVVTSLYRLGLVGRKLLCNHSLPSPSVPCSFLSPGFQDSMKWASVSGLAILLRWERPLKPWAKNKSFFPSITSLRYLSQMKRLRDAENGFREVRLLWLPKHVTSNSLGWACGRNLRKSGKAGSKKNLRMF